MNSTARGNSLYNLVSAKGNFKFDKCVEELCDKTHTYKNSMDTIAQILCA